MPKVKNGEEDEDLEELFSWMVQAYEKSEPESDLSRFQVTLEDNQIKSITDGETKASLILKTRTNR